VSDEYCSRVNLSVDALVGTRAMGYVGMVEVVERLRGVIVDGVVLTVSEMQISFADASAVKECLVFARSPVIFHGICTLSAGAQRSGGTNSREVVVCASIAVSTTKTIIWTASIANLCSILSGQRGTRTCHRTVVGTIAPA